MTDDWSRFVDAASTKSDEQLEVEADMPDHLGGNATMRGAARSEIKKRDRAAAKSLADKQLQITTQQTQIAKIAAWAAWGSALAGLLAFALGSIQVLDARRTTSLAMRPSVTFFTGEEPDETTAGIKLMNDGPGIAVIKRLAFYVDKKPVKDWNEALDYGHIDDNGIFYYEFEKDDTLSSNANHWILYRSTKLKKGLDKFLDFIDQNLAIEVEFCSLDGQCRIRCSTPGRCQ